MLNQFSWQTKYSFSGMHIIESEAATEWPKGKPRTDDTKEMIEHFHAMGLVQRVPCAYSIGDKMVMHPKLYAKLRDHTRKASENMKEEMAKRALFGTYGW